MHTIIKPIVKFLFGNKKLELNPSKHLKTREWATFIFLICVMGTHLWVSYQFAEGSFEQPLFQKEQPSKILVHIVGAVENPGKYTVTKGTRCKELKKKLRYKKRADRTIMQSNRKLRNKEIIYIPYKNEFQLESKW